MHENLIIFSISGAQSNLKYSIYSPTHRWFITHLEVLKILRKELKTATEVPSHAKACYSVGVRSTEDSQDLWHRESESCYSLHSNIQPLKWEMGKSSPSPNLTRRINPLGLSTHQFPVTQAMDSPASCPGKVSVGVMSLTATHISYLAWPKFSFP